MDAPKQVQHGVIQFLCKEGMSPSDILRRMKDVYEDACLKRSTVFKWSVEFRGGQVSTADGPRPGQVSVITEEKIAAVDTLVQENHCITVRELSTAVNISMGSIHQILHAHLGNWKVCAQWVPKHLTDEQKKNSVCRYPWTTAVGVDAGWCNDQRPTLLLHLTESLTGHQKQTAWKTLLGCTYAPR
jgi:transposase